MQIADAAPLQLPDAMPPLVLCVALPPPMMGQAAASEMLIAALDRAGWAYRTVNFAGAFRTGSRLGGMLQRALQVAALPFRLVRQTAPLREAPIFYFQIGQGPAALLRDLPLLGHAASRGWPIVLHVHGGGFRTALARSPAPLRWAIEAIVRRSARAIVLSDSLAPMFDGLLDRSRIVSIDNGVDPALAAAGAAAVRAPSAKAGLTALFLGNLMELKGYVAFLEAARLDAARGARHHFVLAGAPTDTTTTDPAAFVQSHGLANVRIEGPVRGERKHALLAEADAFFLPTRYPVEGQPIAILEALHFGLPVVATRAGAIPDVIRAEENGLFVEADDPQALLAALDLLADDPSLRARCAKNNRALARTRFTAEAHGERMLRVFAEVAAEMRR